MVFIPRIKHITTKRLKQLEKQRSSKEYNEWKAYVLERDENRCQYPGCDKTQHLQIHHIKRFADRQHLRHETFNGIALCPVCHEQKVTGHETAYEDLFFKITLAREKAFKEKKSNVTK